MDFTFKSPYPFESMQSWKPAMAAQGEEALNRSSRSVMARCRAPRTRGARPHGVQRHWDKPRGRNRQRPRTSREGHSRIGREGRQELLDFILDFLPENLDTRSWPSSCTMTRGRRRDPADPNTHISLSDAGAHLMFATPASACT
jgi:hypothetical protein